ncbi:MAG: GNAT family N-acetyltransferase [Eubacteriales bacterium]|nr:GNAT family N-acetyltransferase [Eubacteriales bacterium]
MQNYEEERGFIPALPSVETMPDLTPYAENGFSFAAFDGDTMLGFLCSVSPFKNVFGSTDVTGVFSPMGANGAAGNNRAAIYARLYQAAGEKWVRAGASSHAICLYAHDKAAQEQFFRYGFGMRCVDAIRFMDNIEAPPCDGYTFDELTEEDFIEVYPLDTLLNKGYAESPFFMYRESDDETAFLKNAVCNRSIYHIAWYRRQAVAFIRAELDGETFIKNTPGYLHCKGLYCMPEHRGKGIGQNLLHILIQRLKKQGYTRLGVDFESINPAAYGFWLKHFTAYTHSVVRRID